MTKRNSSKKSLALENLIRLVPGYDPYKNCGDSWFDPVKASEAIEFIEACCSHIEGSLAGHPFVLEQWEKAIIANLFGWFRKDELGRTVRRYREVLIYVPRKNGKTPLMAAIAILIFFTDGEIGQQNYCAAGEREQATLVFRHIAGMIQNEPEMSNRVKLYKTGRSIVNEVDGSFIKVLSADADTKHGGNSHLIMFDELHVQPNRDLVDTLVTSMASANRKQPLIVYITTADYYRESICNEKYDYACKVRDAIIDDPAFLPVIYEVQNEKAEKIVGEKDGKQVLYWQTEDAWKEANPNLGVSVSLDYIRRECQRAIETPSYENTFKRLHLNIRTQQDVRWLPADLWATGDMSFDENELAGMACYAGIDLSTKIDLTNYCLLFPPSRDKYWRAIWRIFVPKECAEQRERRDKVPYITWARQSWIELTEGNVVDYEFIKDRLFQDAKKFDIQTAAYDPWNATQIALQLQDLGLSMVEFGQGFRSMSEPAKEVEKLLKENILINGCNPVAKWAASNVAIELDPAGNIKPSKKKSTERIDPIVTLVMALGLATTQPQSASVYDERGLLFL